MADESGMYEGKVKGSPVKLQIAENGLLVFDKNGHGIIWEYKALLGWDATRKGVELDTVDGTTVRIVCSNQMVICALMTEKAMAMAGSVAGRLRDRGFRAFTKTHWASSYVPISIPFLWSVLSAFIPS